MKLALLFAVIAIGFLAMMHHSNAQYWRKQYDGLVAADQELKDADARLKADDLVLQGNLKQLEDADEQLKTANRELESSCLKLRQSCMKLVSVNASMSSLCSERLVSK